MQPTDLSGHLPETFTYNKDIKLQEMDHFLDEIKISLKMNMLSIVFSLFQNNTIIISKI